MFKSNFITQFFKNWRQVGSLFPSSIFLASHMVRRIDLKNSEFIIELGPGTGVITKKILKKMSDKSRLVVFETNSAFREKLKKINDGRLQIVGLSALDMGKYLKENQVDCIVSGIPLANLSDGEKLVLVHNIKNYLKPGGIFIQFQYTLESKDLLKSLFDRFKLSFTILNAPPAFVYTCVK